MDKAAAIKRLRGCVPLEAIDLAKHDNKLNDLAKAVSEPNGFLSGTIWGMLLLAYAIGYYKAVKDYGKSL